MFRRPINYVKSKFAKPLSNTVTSTAPSTNPVAYWLLGVGGLVAGMVTVGGITRLTKSGLSMTNRLVDGKVWTEYGPKSKERNPCKSLSFSYSFRNGFCNLYLFNMEWIRSSLSYS